MCHHSQPSVIIICVHAQFPHSISPRNLTVLEGETASIVCHGVHLNNLQILYLSDEWFANITRPCQRAEPQGNSILVNMTFYLPNLKRQEDGLKLCCVQLDLYSDIAVIHVFGEGW